MRHSWGLLEGSLLGKQWLLTGFAAQEFGLFDKSFVAGVWPEPQPIRQKTRAFSLRSLHGQGACSELSSGWRGRQDSFWPHLLVGMSMVSAQEAALKLPTHLLASP